MRAMSWMLALALGLTSVACARTIENVETVYLPISGSIEVAWRFQTEGVERVRYLLDGTAIGTGAVAADRFRIVLDTRGYPNGVHALRSEALDAEGQVLRAVTTTLLIRNP